MNRTAPAGTAGERAKITSRFVVLSALAGLAIGIFEAVLLRSSPRVKALLVPDIGDVEWFLAPLVDMTCLGLWRGDLKGLKYMILQCPETFNSLITRITVF